jgi:hypothetical protein
VRNVPVVSVSLEQIVICAGFPSTIMPLLRAADELSQVDPIEYELPIKLPIMCKLATGIAVPMPTPGAV